MALQLRDGDYLPDGMGGLRRVEGREALLQRVFFRLKARRGQFPFLEELGSRLWLLGRVPVQGRKSAAEQYVVEALANEPDLSVEQVTFCQDGNQGVLTVDLSWQDETLSLTMALP